MEELKVKTLKERILAFYRRKYAGKQEMNDTKALLHVFKGRCRKCGMFGHKGAANCTKWIASKTERRPMNVNGHRYTNISSSIKLITYDCVCTPMQVVQI